MAEPIHDESCGCRDCDPWHYNYYCPDFGNRCPACSSTENASLRAQLAEIRQIFESTVRVKNAELEEVQEEIAPSSARPPVALTDS